MDVITPSGLARLTWHGAQPSADTTVTGLLLLGHGAGGGIAAPDLLVTAHVARDLGMAVGLVEQPYRVLAGRRPPPPAAQLDPAFTAVAAAAREALAAYAVFDVPLVVGGRSSGARVACRTALGLGACAVIALAFPLRPPRPPGKARPTRLPELVGCAVAALVIQGDRDPFGSPTDISAALAADPAAGAEIVVSPAVGADHALRKGIDAQLITHFLARFLP